MNRFLSIPDSSGQAHHVIKDGVMGDPWLSVEQIAAHFGIKLNTVYKLISRYQMPAHKVGRLWKFQLNEVDVWVRSRKSAFSIKQDK